MKFIKFIKFINLTILILLFTYLLLLVFGYPIFKTQVLNYDNIIYIKKINKNNGNIGLFQKIVIQKKFNEIANDDLLEADVKTAEIFKRLNRTFVQNIFLIINYIFWGILILLCIFNIYKNKIYINKLINLVFIYTFIFILLRFSKNYFSNNQTTNFTLSNDNFINNFEFFILIFFAVYFSIILITNFIKNTKNIKIANYVSFKLQILNKFEKFKIYFLSNFSFLIHFILIIIFSLILNNLILFPIYKLQLNLPNFFSLILILFLLLLLFYYIYSYKIKYKNFYYKLNIFDSLALLSYNIIKNIVIFVGIFILILILINSIVLITNLNSKLIVNTN